MTTVWLISLGFFLGVCVAVAIATREMRKLIDMFEGIRGADEYLYYRNYSAQNIVLRRALREAMEYVESTDGTRGESFGSAVNACEYLAWVRLVGGAE